MIRSVYRFHVDYHVRRILKNYWCLCHTRPVLSWLIILILSQNFKKICEDYRVPNDPMKYRDEKFYWTCQRGVHWPDDKLGPDSMPRWILEKSVGFTDVGLLRVSESVRAYAYLILSCQASARSGIVDNTASALTAQSAFLNKFENVVNRRLDIQEDIKCYQDTLSYASSKVDYSVSEHLYMLPSDMNLKIRSGTVGYNNKILVSDAKFILGKNEKVNSLEAPSAPQADTPAISHKDSNLVKQTAVTNRDSKTAVTHEGLEKKPTITHENKKRK